MTENTDSVDSEVRYDQEVSYRINAHFESKWRDYVMSAIYRKFVDFFNLSDQKYVCFVRKFEAKTKKRNRLLLVSWPATWSDCIYIHLSASRVDDGMDRIICSLCAAICARPNERWLAYVCSFLDAAVQGWTFIKRIARILRFCQT